MDARRRFCCKVNGTVVPWSQIQCVLDVMRRAIPLIHAHTSRYINPFVQHEDMKSSTVLSNSGHDRLRNSVLFSRRSRAIRTRSVHAPQPSSFRLCQRQVFWKVSVLSQEDPLHVKMRQERGEQNQFRRLEIQKERFFFFADLVALGFHSTKYKSTHVSVFPHRTEPLICAKSTVKCRNRMTVRCVCRTQHTNSVSQQHAIQ